MWKYLGALLALLVLCGYKAGAQGAYLGPELGVYNARGADNSKLTGGLALRMKLSPMLGLEGSVGYRQEEYAGGQVTAKSWPVMVTGLIYPLPIVYGAIGAGWYNSRLDYNVRGADLGSQTMQKFGWHFGGGMELPVGDNARLFGDVRYVFLNYDFKQFPGSNGLNSDFYVLSVGMLFRL